MEVRRETNTQRWMDWYHGCHWWRALHHDSPRGCYHQCLLRLDRHGLDRARDRTRDVAPHRWGHRCAGRWQPPHPPTLTLQPRGIAVTFGEYCRKPPSCNAGSGGFSMTVRDSVDNTALASLW